MVRRPGDPTPRGFSPTTLSLWPLLGWQAPASAAKSLWLPPDRGQTFAVDRMMVPPNPSVEALTPVGGHYEVGYLGVIGTWGWDPQGQDQCPDGRDTEGRSLSPCPMSSQ